MTAPINVRSIGRTLIRCLAVVAVLLLALYLMHLWGRATLDSRIAASVAHENRGMPMDFTKNLRVVKVEAGHLSITTYLTAHDLTDNKQLAADCAALDQCTRDTSIEDPESSDLIDAGGSLIFIVSDTDGHELRRWSITR